MPLIPIAVTGAIELIKLGIDVLHTWKTNPENQDEIDQKWEKMQTRFEALKADWRSRHPKT